MLHKSLYFYLVLVHNDLCSEKCHLLIISVKKQMVDSHVVHRIHYAGELGADGEGKRKDQAGGWGKRYWER